MNLLSRMSAVLALTCVGALFAAPAKPPAAPDKAFAGSEVCITCHGEFARLWEKQRHSQYLLAKGRKEPGKGCEECHGPGKAHADGDRKAIVSIGPMVAERQSAVCLACHQDYVRKAQWYATAHARQRMACTTCHPVHRSPKASPMLAAEPTELCIRCHPRLRPMLRQNSHHPVVEHRMKCASCHDVHRSTERAMLKAPVGVLCTTCHRDKEGPFTYEHDPVVSEMSDSCLACHTPHGSGNVQLLRLGSRGLCMQCHTDKVAHFPGPRCWTSGCHTRVHGSNTNQLFF
ncbi:MAG: cytochrome c3 family protein [Armatimonadota bacterium]